MGDLVRFGVSLDKGLLGNFDELIAGEGYTNRSEAIRDLIRERFAKREWECDRVVVASVALVYDHDQPGLAERLLKLQHNQREIISTSHIHLDGHRCLESILIKDKSKSITLFAHKLKSVRGVKQCSVAMCSLEPGE